MERVLSYQADPGQDAVIDADVDTRLQVIAGPGNGKTRTLQQRIARLHQMGVQEHKILAISFTRVAVREVRERVSLYSRQGGASTLHAGELQISTLDSLAGRLLHHFSEHEGSWDYDANILKAIELLESEEKSHDLLSWLGRFEHVLVDEAQDFVGIRARLLVALLEALPLGCGWSIFLDPHQAIYGWQEDQAEEEQDTHSFQELFEASSLWHHEVIELERFYRSSDPALIHQLTTARNALEHAGAEAEGQLRELLQQGAAVEGYLDDAVAELVQQDKQDLLVLFRNRGSAFRLSSFLHSKGISHRLRMGNLTKEVSGWVALILNSIYLEHEEIEFKESEFRDAWDELSDEFPHLTEGWTVQAAWNALRRLNGRGNPKKLSIPRIADGIVSGRDTDELFSSNRASSVPIVGTIHGSKGCEANEVLLSLPPERAEWAAAEARVLYVGMSRAKRELRINPPKKSDSYFSYTAETRRVWRYGGRQRNRHRFNIEFGRPGDICPRFSMMMGIHPDWDVEQKQARLEQRQMTLAQEARKPHPSHVIRYRRKRYELLCGFEDDQEPFAALSQDFIRDLKEIAGHKKVFFTSAFHLHMIGITTIAMPADHPCLLKLPEPWTHTRVWLLPVYAGMPTWSAKPSKY